jgi:hypothetical protein
VDQPAASTGPDFLGFAIPHSWAEVGSAIGGVATVAGVAIALVAAGFAWGQMTSSRKTQREAIALQRYNDYLKLAFQHPQFASGALGDKPDDPDFFQYEWFVKLMLNACEGIVLFVGDDPQWVDSIKAQIRWHAKYCRTNPWFNRTYKLFYIKELCDLVDQVCGER